MTDLKKLPVWVFYIAILLLVSGAYSAFLFSKVGRLEKDLKAKGGENSRLEQDIRNVKSGHSIQIEALESQIEILDGKIKKAEENFRAELDTANKEAIKKLEDERNAHIIALKIETARIIAYYQKKFKTAATPPPPKKKKK